MFSKRLHTKKTEAANGVNRGETKVANLPHTFKTYLYVQVNNLVALYVYVLKAAANPIVRRAR